MENSHQHDSLGLAGLVAVITGSSRGIGAAVADCLAANGAHLVVNYLRDEAAAAAVVRSAQGRGVEALAVQGDISTVAAANRLIATALEKFGRIDILVCNAGIWKGAPVELVSEALWDETLDTNLKGTWAVCRAAVPQMKEQQFGRIVIISSTAGQRGEANYSNYAASKGAQISFTKSLAAELGPFGITVNAVAPGWVDTEMSQEPLADLQSRAQIEALIPLRRVATAAEIAWPVTFLCSDWASHITGEILNVNGGSVLCG